MSDKDRDDARNNQFMRVLAQELNEVPETERLDKKDEAAALEFGMEIFSAAKAEAGRRRLERAKQRLAAVPKPETSTNPNVSIDEARTYLRSAMQKPGLTLAARELGDMSEADILLLYEQIRLLESEQED
jgi:hypothetical protein